MPESESWHATPLSDIDYVSTVNTQNDKMVGRDLDTFFKDPGMQLFNSFLLQRSQSFTAGFSNEPLGIGACKNNALAKRKLIAILFLFVLSSIDAQLNNRVHCSWAQGPLHRILPSTQDVHLPFVWALPLYHDSWPHCVGNR